MPFLARAPLGGDGNAAVRAGSGVSFGRPPNLLRFDLAAISSLPAFFLLLSPRAWLLRNSRTIRSGRCQRINAVSRSSGSRQMARGDGRKILFRDRKILKIYEKYERCCVMIR